MSDAHRVILQLLYRSNHKLLKLSFFLFPVALYISMSSYLFVDTLLKSYEAHLSQSYLGFQGRLSLSSDAKTIEAIIKHAKAENYIVSPRIDLKRNIVIKSDKDIVKYSKMILLEKAYLEKKFQSVQANHLYINSVLAQNLGEASVESIKGLFFDDVNATLDIEATTVIDTGFLSSEPIIFLPLERVKKILPDVEKGSLHSVEFYETHNSVVQKIKKELDEIAKQQQSMRISIHDLLLDTKEHREFFHKLDQIKNIIIFFIFAFVLAIVLVSIALLIRFKYLSLKVLHFLGMSHLDLTRTITSMVAFMVIVMTFLAFVSLGLWQELFLMMSHFSQSFFQSVDLMTGILVLVSGLFIVIVTYLFSRFIFKGAMP
jgi:hypothetical protein